MTSIGPAQAAYAERVADRLAAAGLRTVTDLRPERLARKIVDAREAGIPILAAVGAREARDGTVSLRWRHGEQEVVALDAAVSRLDYGVSSMTAAPAP